MLRTQPPLRRLPSPIRSTQVVALLAAAVVALAALPTGALAVGPGETAPDFSAPRLDGAGTLSLGSYRGKVVYVDFWASWCGPCLSAVPALEKLRSEFSGDDFQILAVNLDKQAAKAKKFVAKQKIGYPSVVDPAGRLPRQFGLETMPTSYIVDRQGVVRYVHEGFDKSDVEQLRREIKRWVAK